MDIEKDAYGVEEFCRRHDISRAYLYILWKRNVGPKFMQVGSRRLISKEAGEAWRRSLEGPSQAA